MGPGPKTIRVHNCCEQRSEYGKTTGHPWSRPWNIQDQWRAGSLYGRSSTFRWMWLALWSGTYLIAAAIQFGIHLAPPFISLSTMPCVICLDVSIQESRGLLLRGYQYQFLWCLSSAAPWQVYPHGPLSILLTCESYFWNSSRSSSSTWIQCQDKNSAACTGGRYSPYSSGNLPSSDPRWTYN